MLKRSFHTYISHGTMLLLMLFSALALTSSVVANDGDAEIFVAAGEPGELPADGKSQTLLEVDLSKCRYGGVPVDPDGMFYFTANTTLGRISPTSASSLDNDEIPPLLTLTAGNIPGETTITIEVAYCPPGGVMVFGVCSDQASIDAICRGSTTYTFFEIEPAPTAEIEPAPTAENNQAQTNPEQAASSESSPAESDPNTDSTSSDEQPSRAQLMREWEEYLAGEGIGAPTPGQVAASGIAITTLLAGWLILNQFSGISVEKSLHVISAWRHGENLSEVKPKSPGKPDSTSSEQPPVETTAEPAKPVPPVIQAEPPASVPEAEKVQQPAPAAPSTPKPAKDRKPAQEGKEDRVLRGVQDAQDLDDAMKNTREGFDAFEKKVPQEVRDSEAWKKYVEPKLKKFRDMLAKTKLDKARTWLDRSKQLIKLREQINRDLDHLPSDSREAIVWTERTLKTLGHFASDTYQTMVIDPAKAAGNAVLPADLAKRFNTAMDELNKDLATVVQQIGDLPRQGTRLLTHGNLQDQAQQMIDQGDAGTRETGQMIQDLHGPRDVPVEYPDFWGKGTRKVRELWDSSLGRLFK